MSVPNCHCGRPAIVHDNGGQPYTRGLCEDCDAERCDAPQEGETYSCQVGTSRTFLVQAGNMLTAEEAQRLLRLMDRQSADKWTITDRMLYVNAHTIDELWRRTRAVLVLHAGEHFCNMPGAPRLGQKYGASEMCPTAAALEATP